MQSAPKRHRLLGQTHLLRILLTCLLAPAAVGLAPGEVRRLPPPLPLAIRSPPIASSCTGR